MFAVLLPAFFLFWQSAFELSKIEIEGLQRFEAQAVLATVGLKAGTTAGKAEFDAACGTLVQTGLFQGCNWKYAPISATSVALTLSVEEAPATQAVRLSVPGVEDKELWDWLRANEPLVQQKMPGSDAATDFYTRAIQRYLKKEVVSSVDTNLNTRETTLVFRPADLPTIDRVKFEGAEAIPAATLEKVLAPIARGTSFTEYDVRRLLDLNVRPMYENSGRLNVRFPSIRADGGTVTVQVDEGSVYKLGSVEVSGGPGVTLPTGETAEWNRILAAVDKAGAELRNRGHLQASHKIARKLANDVVDLAITFQPGPQFTFNTLQLHGLNPAQQSNVAKLWSLPRGAPMNEGYVNDFLKAAFDKLGSEYRGVAHQFDSAGGTSVNVVITFRR